MWTKEAYQAYLKSTHWKAVQKAVYRMKPLCFIHRRCRKLNLHHLKYDNLWHESLILDGKHDLVVLCKRLHLDFHAWAERLRVQPNAGMLVLYQRDLQLY
jgi:hypothetical protein